MKLKCLSHLSNAEFDSSLASAISREQQSVAWVLTHLVEAEGRKRYLPLGYPSLYEYCVQALHMTESVAYKRTAAARVLRRFPALLEAIADGRLSLSALVLLQPHLTELTHRELVNAVENRTIADVRLILATRFPQPDLPTFVHAHVASPACAALPEPERQEKVTELDTYPIENLESRLAMPSVALSSTPMATSVQPATPSRLTPRAPDRFALQVMLSAAAHADLVALRELLGHSVPSGELSAVLARALSMARELAEKQKYAATDTPRASHGSHVTRYIPAELKREVHERDGGQCTFVGSTGKRCGSRTRLEFDHRVPIAKGGTTGAANLRLLCRAHNHYEAERELGEQQVRRARGAAVAQRNTAAQPLRPYRSRRIAT